MYGLNMQWIFFHKKMNATGSLMDINKNKKKKE